MKCVVCNINQARPKGEVCFLNQCADQHIKKLQESKEELELKVGSLNFQLVKKNTMIDNLKYNIDDLERLLSFERKKNLTPNQGLFLMFGAAVMSFSIGVLFGVYW